LSFSGEPATRRGSAFGLSLDADFEVDGLLPAPDGTALPKVVLRLSDEAAIAKVWRPDEATRLSAERAGGGSGPDRTIDAHPTLGYRLYARYFGLCLISPDGGRVLSAPPPVASWRWQRFLTGRGLPIAALLRGYEVLHAGAVAVDGGVVGIVGATGAGKTSLTLQLVLQQAQFVTDDVLVLEAVDDGLLAHPGIGVVNVRAAEHERLGAAARAMLGELLGRTGRDKLHYAMSAVAEPLPLTALYFLRPGAERGVATIRELRTPEPVRLLASTFVTQVRPPERLASLVDACARLAASVPMFEIAMGTREDAAELAARLRAHLVAAVVA
jgi:hypothetical protein